MSWSESLYGWLVYSALVGLVVSAIGSGVALLCRQPLRRLRIIELTLAGCLIAPWLGMIPGYPQLAIGWRHIGTGALVDEKTHSADRPLAENMDLSPSAVRAGPAEVVPQVPVGVPPETITTAAPPPAQAWYVGPWIVTLYLFGVAMGVAWWLTGVAALLRIIGTARLAPPRCRQLLAEIAGPRGDRVRLLISSRAKQPFAFVGMAVRLPIAGAAVQLPPQQATPPRRGWRRAVVVLPESLCHDEQAVRWSLAHEWAHIERHDFRVWFAAGLARVLFFYQPLVWWLRRQLRLCQDFVADARASRQAPQPEDYAEFLTVRAAAGTLHPAMIGLGMGFSKSELYRRVIMLVQNPPLESRPPRLWTVSVTCAALLLVAVVAALTISPERATAVPPQNATDSAQSATGSASAVSPDATQRPDSSTPDTGKTRGTPPPFTAKLPCGVVVELLGISEHPSKETSWWRPDGSPLAEPPCDPLKGPVDGGPHHVAREFAVQWHNLPSEPVGTQVLFDPPYNAYAGGNPKRLGKNVAGLEAMSVSLPDQPTVTVRVSVAAGPWQTVQESERGDQATGSMGRGVAFSHIYEKDGDVFVAVAHNVHGPETRVIAIGKDGKEHCAASQSSNGAAGFTLLSAMFSKLSLANIRAFRLESRAYQRVEFRNVSLRSGQKTDVQIVQVAAPPVADKVEWSAPPNSKPITATKPEGPVLTYEVDPNSLPAGAAAPDMMDKLLDVVDRRLTAGREELARVGKQQDGRIVVTLARKDDAVRKRVERLLARPGTLEFRILANNQHDKATIDQALKEPAKTELRDSSGKRLAWWIPVKAGQERNFADNPEIARRTRKQDNREITEVLVVTDPYNVTGAYLTWASVRSDQNGRPCLGFTCNEAGGQLFSKLTGDHLPDKATGFAYKLGIILDGELYSAPAIQSAISGQGQITGSFTAQEVSDLADLLNAGSLPVRLRLVEEQPHQE